MNSSTAQLAAPEWEAGLGPPLTLEHAMGLDYDLYWHPAPIFQPNNFFGNPTNFWAPSGILSFMVLGIPHEHRDRYKVPFKAIAHKDEWWNALADNPS